MRICPRRDFPTAVMPAPTRASRRPRRSATSASNSFTTRSGRPGSCRSSVASWPRSRLPPAGAVTKANRRRRPVPSSTSLWVARGGATRTPRATSFRAGGPGWTSCRSCATRLCSRATRWWTSCPRLPISTRSQGRPVPPGAASYRIRARCYERAGWMPWTASRAMRRACSEPPSTTAF